MATTAADLGLTTTQYNWAIKIVARVKSKNLPDDQGQRAADIALAVCIVESGLKMYANKYNAESMRLPHDAVGSDHGSVGLYQQQVGGAPNSTANWGTTKQLMDVNVSTDHFLDALLHGAYGRTRMRGGAWLGMTNGVAAQNVQGSAFPDRYAQQGAWAVRIRKALWGVTAPSQPSQPEGDQPLNAADKAWIDKRIAQAFRAYHLGGRFGPWDPAKFGRWIKNASNGVGDRLTRLEKKK